MHEFYEILKRDQMFRDDVESEYHTCPFRVDVCDDSETLCTCDAEQEQICADDI